VPWVSCAILANKHPYKLVNTDGAASLRAPARPRACLPARLPAGLPRILVDLRHESTHNELPSAASLRLAADQALAWLQLNYWQRQAEHLEGCRDKMGELVQVHCIVGRAGGRFQECRHVAQVCLWVAGCAQLCLGWGLLGWIYPGIPGDGNQGSGVCASWYP
jgi:hypothetical protein